MRAYEDDSIEAGGFPFLDTCGNHVLACYDGHDSSCWPEMTVKVPHVQKQGSRRVPQLLIPGPSYKLFPFA